MRTIHTNMGGEDIYQTTTHARGADMKTLKQLIAVATLVAVPFMTSGIVAAEDGSISDTGPGSTNTIDTEIIYTCEVDNDNQITITDSNDQQVYSGPVDASDNTDSGDAISGSATNDNGTTFDIQIENETCVASVVEETPTPEEPTTPAETVTPTEKSEPVVLADTASSNSIYALIILGVVALGAAAGTVAVARIAKR